MSIPFHKSFIAGKEQDYIHQVINSGSVSGNGVFTRHCHRFFENYFGFKKVLLTNSCTDALEMCSLLLDLQPGDEIILPSYTFVSTANAFVNFGVKPVFVDSQERNPNVNPDLIEKNITSKTKAIVVMHYAGAGCDMDQITFIAKKHNLKIIEDAALGLGSKYKGKWLGSIGDLATFSFHQTKNITCGEGGLLVINNPEFILKSEVIWEKGTNRAAYLRGESDKYEWVSKGSSYLTSEIHAAFLLAQLEKFDEVQQRRVDLWMKYYNELKNIQNILLPDWNDYLELNGSIFYFLLSGKEETDSFISFMAKNNISVGKHYRCLHSSSYAKIHFVKENLLNCEKIAENLIRLPLYFDLSDEEQDEIIMRTKTFFNHK